MGMSATVMNKQETDMTSTTKQGNNLFPVFLKLEQMTILIVGGGNVALEKLHAVLSNSPLTKIKLVAVEVNEEIKKLTEKHNTIEVFVRAFESEDLNNVDLVIVAVNDIGASEKISREARSYGKLVNVADKPEL